MFFYRRYDSVARDCDGGYTGSDITYVFGAGVERTVALCARYVVHWDEWTAFGERSVLLALRVGGGGGGSFTR